MMAQPLGVALLRRAVLAADDVLYGPLLRPLIFRRSAQDAHEAILRMMRWADQQRLLRNLFDVANHVAFAPCPVQVGGVTLESPLILAAGLIKGDGFESEEAALAAVRRGDNVMPGWWSMARLVGPAEFGSFTRWPRMGNPGTVVWRDAATRSTQNRVGLRNPGAHAAAEFLTMRRDRLPAQYGINVAISPGVENTNAQAQEVREAFSAFTERGIQPAWFTLNLSCPNTEDDPASNQTDAATRLVCQAALDSVGDVPLWIKFGPNLADEQYRVLLRVAEETGVRAVVATNTLPADAPEPAGTQAGFGGGRLHGRAVQVAGLLAAEKAAHGYAVDIIGCGGVLDTASFQAFATKGIHAVQYWSALVYGGPLAAAHIAAKG